MHSPAFGIENMHFDSDSSKDQDMEIDHDSNSSSNLRLGRLVVVDSFSNE